MGKSSIALLTYQKLPHLCPDDKNLKSAFHAAGLEAHEINWDEPQDWKKFQAVLIRTTWNYFHRQHEFIEVLKEIEALGIPVFHSSSIVKWNSHKSYLLELQKKGLPVPKTKILDPFKVLSRQIEDFPGDFVVLKPFVGAAGFHAFKIPKTEADLFSIPVSTGEMMIQEYLPSIEEEGEFSFIYFSGGFSHAVCKRAKKGEFRVQDDHGGHVLAHTPSDLELNEVRSIVAALPFSFLYLRVDVARGREGIFQIIELEAIEPELFFRFSKGGEERLVKQLYALL